MASLMPPPDFEALSAALLPAVLDAARLQLGYFNAGVEIERKSDKSPVTVADRESEAVLLAALARAAPGIPVVAEESVAAGRVPAASDRYFLVDALDGTNLFIQGKPEFSINIALVDGTRPVYGLIYAPPTGQLFVTAPHGPSLRAIVACGAGPVPFKSLVFTRNATRQPDRENLLAFNSRSAGAAGNWLLEALHVRHRQPMGSSLKFCLIAAGEGDLYARIGPTSEWDTAAGQAILEAAGGSVTTLDGAPLRYGQGSGNYLNPHFVAWARRPLATGLKPPPAPVKGA